MNGGDPSNAMRDSDYWRRYPVETPPDEILRILKRVPFSSTGEDLELLMFERGSASPSVVISPGSAGHAFVFAELGYRVYERGYNVFIMPKHGGRTVDELVQRHDAALARIARIVGDRIGVFGEGLGGYVVFYMGLRGGRARSIICENSPAILTEGAFHAALGRGGGAARRRRVIVPFARLLARVVPRLKLPIRLHLDFTELVDANEEIRRLEQTMVEAYLKDPDFDRSYPLGASLSLLLTPPPRPLDELVTPTMFIVATRGLIPEYEKALFQRLPSIHKKLVEVDGSVFWMCSHPREAATLICDWFDETLQPQLVQPRSAVRGHTE
jgi:pimeloyl-ACP methyl ester carboxylesterase